MRARLKRVGQVLAVVAALPLLLPVGAAIVMLWLGLAWIFLKGALGLALFVLLVVAGGVGGI